MKIEIEIEDANDARNFLEHLTETLDISNEDLNIDEFLNSESEGHGITISISKT